MDPRLRAVCDLQVTEAREYAGLHDDYDGVVQDLSPSGVTAGLSRLGQGPRLRDRHDEDHLVAFEDAMRTVFGTLEFHRRSPLPHLGNLDLSCYDREYAPLHERQAARARHLSAWPDAVDAALESLDMVPAPVATAMLPAVQGLAADVDDTAALEAHSRLVTRVEALARDGDPDASLGRALLTRLMSDGEATAVDLSRLADRAQQELERLTAMLGEACGRLRPGVPPAQLLPELQADHPTEPEDIYAEARALIAEATTFTIERDLLPDPGGDCNVGPAPESRRLAMAMMVWSAPYEDDAPSWYYVTPPDESWPDEDKEEWLSVFSRTTLPAITVHEVTPGHYAHGRMLRRLDSDVRRCLFSGAFVEGWAHYAEELFVEESFRDGDPKFVIGMCIEALVRVTRLVVAIGVHTGAMTLTEATERFVSDAFLQGSAARSEAMRATWDPTYGRYTWGKLEIMALRDEAMARWGRRYSHRRFHDALMALGAPPLGLMGDILGTE